MLRLAVSVEQSLLTPDFISSNPNIGKMVSNVASIKNHEIKTSCLS